MKKIVIDASMALAFCLEDERGSIASKLLETIADYQIIVPPHWGVEVGNGLLMAFRRNRITQGDIATALKLIAALEATTISVSMRGLADSIIPIADLHKLTVYDAYYLHIAKQEAAVLATLDSALQKAGKKEKMDVFAINRW